MDIGSYSTQWAVTLIKGVFAAFALVVVAGVIARYTGVVDRYFIYFPDREVSQDPGDKGIKYEDVTLVAADGVRLHGWFVPGPGEITWVWFHGNAGNISHRMENLVDLHDRLGLNVFIFDYRGYGRSEGRPSEQGTYLDAEAALAYVKTRPDVDGRKIVLFGRSLGCAIVAEVAISNEVYAVVLESPFTSVQALAKRAYPFLPGIGALVRTRYDTLSKGEASERARHGAPRGPGRDRPIRHGRELFEAAKPPKRFYTIAEAGHNDTYLVGGSAYYGALADFLRDPSAAGG